MYAMIERNRKLRVADSGVLRGSPSFSTFTLEDAERAVAAFIASRPADIKEDAEEGEARQAENVQTASASSQSTKKQVQRSKKKAEDEEDANHEEDHHHHHDDHECDAEPGEDGHEEEYLQVAADAFSMEQKVLAKMVQEWNGLAFDPDKQSEANAKEEELRRIAAKLDKDAKKRALDALAELKRKQQEALMKWKEAEVIRKQLEEARLKAIRDKQERERERQAAIQLEEQRQQQLQRMGHCSYGYRWIHRGGGRYQCAGGGHWHEF